MTINILYAGHPDDWPEYARALNSACRARGLDVSVSTGADPASVDYIVLAPNGPVTDFSPYANARAVLNLWAGVERIIGNPTLTQPLARMADSGLREGMVEWVTGHVLRYHLGLDRHILDQTGNWDETSVAPLARTRTVGVLGLGALGAAAGQMLATLNFQVVGWSRTQRNIDGIECYSGNDGLRQVLAASQILVLLLPDTPGTTDVLNAETLALMPRGARIINPGRGPLINDADLIAALDSGHIAHATLDVFRKEPLPANHPFWAHPQVTVTPHIASATRPDTAAKFIAENIVRSESGLPLLAEVDRSVGY